MNDSRRNFLKRAVAGIGAIGLYGCSEPQKEPSTGVKEKTKGIEADVNNVFKCYGPYPISASEADKRALVGYVEGLGRRISPDVFAAEVNGNDGLTFVVYKLTDKNGKELSLVSVDAVSAAEVAETGILLGEETTGKSFTAYSTLEGCLSKLRTEIRPELRAEPISVSGTSVTGTASANVLLRVGEYGREVKYDGTSPIMVVDFKERTVKGLYEVQTLVDLLQDPRLGVTALEARNKLDPGLYIRHGFLVTAMEDFLLGSCLTIEKAKERLDQDKNTRARTYLLDTELDERATTEIVTKFNAQQVKLAELQTLLRSKGFSRKVLLGQEGNFALNWPFSGRHCAELYVDQDNRPKTRLVKKS